MNCFGYTRMLPAVLTIGMLAVAAPAQAGLMLGKVILDLSPDAPARDDIELWNDGTERLYVVAEPAEIVDPGLPTELRKASPDPSVTGLLVTPQKLVLEPNERKLVRVAALAARPARDRVYRVTIKPVAGPVTSDQTALKVYVGYDVLVTYRPQLPTADVVAARSGHQLTFHNHGNSNVELAQGEQCDEHGAKCEALPATRLYPGADWAITTRYQTGVTYQVHSGTKQVAAKF